MRQADETLGVTVTHTTISPQYSSEDSSESEGRAELVKEQNV
jgi:hypothetical protein